MLENREHYVICALTALLKFTSLTPKCGLALQPMLALSDAPMTISHCLEYLCNREGGSAIWGLLPHVNGKQLGENGQIRLGKPWNEQKEGALRLHHVRN